MATELTSENIVPVATGVVVNSAGKILIARRPDHADYAGWWEFPGGKVDFGETITQALARELFEEVGIIVKNSRHLIRVLHTYPTKTVQLNVHWVDQFEGEAWGKEGQPIDWVSPVSLTKFNFLPANESIIKAILFITNN